MIDKIVWSLQSYGSFLEDGL